MAAVDFDRRAQHFFSFLSSILHSRISILCGGWILIGRTINYITIEMTDSTITSLSAEAPFRVIIIGAGVTGLTLAHSLEKSNIDYLVLDKGVVAPSFGTTITMQPHGCRILHQIGVLDAVLAQCSTMGGAHCRTPSGKSFAHNDFFGVVRKK